MSGTTPAPLDLDAIQDLADAATAGPWKVWPQPTVITSRSNAVHAIAAAGDLPGSLVRITVAGHADAAFVAAARELVPALVAEVRRLRAELATQAEHMGELVDQLPDAEETRAGRAAARAELYAELHDWLGRFAVEGRADLANFAADAILGVRTSLQARAQAENAPADAGIEEG